MPSEQEHHEIEALLKALPDLVFPLDSKGRVTQANQAALTTLGLSVDEVRGVALGSLVKGFSFTRWLEAGEIKPQTCKLSLGGEEYLGDLMPLFVAEERAGRPWPAPWWCSNPPAGSACTSSALHAVEVGGFEHLQAESPKMKEVLAQAAKLAMQDAPAHRGRDRHRQESCWPAPVTVPACAPATPSWRSTAPPCRTTWPRRAVRLCPRRLWQQHRG